MRRSRSSSRDPGGDEDESHKTKGRLASTSTPLPRIDLRDEDHVKLEIERFDGIWIQRNGQQRTAEPGLEELCVGGGKEKASELNLSFEVFCVRRAATSAQTAGVAPKTHVQGCVPALTRPSFSKTSPHLNAHYWTKHYPSPAIFSAECVTNTV